MPNPHLPHHNAPNPPHLHTPPPPVGLHYTTEPLSPKPDPEPDPNTTGFLGVGSNRDGVVLPAAGEGLTNTAIDSVASSDVGQPANLAHRPSASSDAGNSGDRPLATDGATMEESGGTPEPSTPSGQTGETGTGVVPVLSAGTGSEQPLEGMHPDDSAADEVGSPSQPDIAAAESLQGRDQGGPAEVASPYGGAKDIGQPGVDNSTAADGEGRSAMNLSDIAARLEAIEAELADPYDEVYAFLDEQDDDFRNTLEGAAQERLQARERPGDHEKSVVALDTLLELGGEAAQARLSAPADLIRSRLNEAMALEAAGAPLANSELQAARDQLVNTVDWEAVITKHLTGQDYSGLNGVIGKIGKAGATSLGVAQATAMAAELRALQGIVAEKGDIRLTDAPQWQPPEGWQPDPSLPEKIEGWLDLTTAVGQRLSLERRSFVSATLPLRELLNMESLCFAAGLRPDDPYAAAVPPVIAHALETHAQTLMERFDEQDAVYLQRGLEQPTPELSIEGQELMRDILGVGDAAGWVQSQLRRHPSELTHGLAVVKFASLNKEITDDQGRVIGRVSGDYRTETKEIRIDVSRGRLAEAFELYGQRGEEGVELAKVAGLYTLFKAADVLHHELTHHAVAHRLPVSFLREWHEVIRREQTHITDYVAYIAEPRPGEGLSEGNQVEEDLADSRALYNSMPLALYELAPERFATLNRYERRYSPQAIEAARADIQQRVGKDKEQAIASWDLAFERAARRQ